MFPGYRAWETGHTADPWSARVAGFLACLKDRLRVGMHKASSSEALSSAQSSQPSPASGSPGTATMFGAHRPDFGTASEDGRCAAASEGTSPLP